jgi:DNA primase
MLAVEPLFCDGPADDRYAREQLAVVQERRLSGRIAELRSRLQRLDAATAGAEQTGVFGELVVLEQQRRALREQALGPA